MSDGSRAGELNLDHGEVVQISFGQLHGPSAMLALMSATGVRHEVVELPPGEQADVLDATHEQTPAAQASAAADPEASQEVLDTDVVDAREEEEEEVEEEEVRDSEIALMALDAEDALQALEVDDALTALDVDAALMALDADANLRALDADTALQALEEAPDEAMMASLEAPLEQPEDPKPEGELDGEPEPQASETSTESEIDDTVRRPRGEVEEDTLMPLAAMVADALRELEADDGEAPAGILPPPTPEQASPELEPVVARQAEEGDGDDTLAPALKEALEPPVIRPVAARRSDWPSPAESRTHTWFVPAVLVGMCAPIAIAVMLWKPTAPSSAPPAALTASQASVAPAAVVAAATTPVHANEPPVPSAPAVLADGPPEWLEGSAVHVAKEPLVPTVSLRVLVGAEGQVRAAAVQTPRPAIAALEQQALEAIKSHRFRPARQGGKAVEAWTVFPLAFIPAPTERALVIKGAEAIGAGLGTAWTHAFENTQPGLRVHADGLGSQAGFASLLDGTADVACSSRPIEREELALAERLGVSLREVVVGYDGIAVVVHPDNAVRELDLEALAGVFAQRLTRWNELAGGDAPIHVLGRPSYSGTRRLFEQRVLAGRTPEATFGPAVETLENSQEIVARIAGDAQAIGYVSLGLVQPSVRTLALRPSREAPAVAASPASLRDGSYPLLRPLLLYLRADSARDARAFVDFVLSPAGQAVLAQHGFLPLSGKVQQGLGDEVSTSAANKPDLLRVYFERGTASIVAGEGGALEATAAALRSGRRALIIGNTDSTGQTAVNLRVAQRRAETVAARLKEHGTGDAPIELQAAGDAFPLATNATEQGRGQNRRADVYVLPR